MSNPAAHQSGSDLPPDLKRVVRDQSVVIPRDGGVFALIGKSVFTVADPPHSNTPPCDCRRCRP